LSFALAGPGFVAELNGMDFPDDGDTIGLISDYANSTAEVVWESTSVEFPDVTITGSSLGFGVPPLDEDYPYTYVDDFHDQYVGPWNLLAGTAMDITCSWTQGADTDMMDFGLYGPANAFGVHANGYGDDEITDWAMASAGGSPEHWGGTLDESGEYWVRILNFAGTAQTGVVSVYALTPGSTVTSTNNTAGFDTTSLAEGTWQMTAQATDSIGGSHQALALVGILNTPADVAPEVTIDTALTGIITGTQTISISVYDDNNNNTGGAPRVAADDSDVWLHIYYTADEAGRYQIPLATFIDVTTESASTATYTFTWDTTKALNTYVARLWVVADDGTALTTASSGVFEIANTAGSGAGMTASSTNNTDFIPVLVLLFAVLGIGTIPLFRKLWRFRRA
jgi:uncharacterized membrane protein